ncbi:hypothetical protein B0H10DRAFT_2050765 [Mycena sp. CBHHK59/15]|nr:hypothetical protein B0H10DRAFT_2050765 [Mycena sp. CBHHK59/15]
MMLHPILSILSLVALAAAQTTTNSTDSLTNDPATSTTTGALDGTSSSTSPSYMVYATGVPASVAYTTEAHTLSAGAIAGVVIGATAIVTTVILAAFFALRSAARARARTRDLENQVRDLGAVVACLEAEREAAVAAMSEKGVPTNRDFTTSRDLEAESGKKSGDVPPKYFS